jgi:hypothetical protein
MLKTRSSTPLHSFPKKSFFKKKEKKYEDSIYSLRVVLPIASEPRAMWYIPFPPMVVVPVQMGRDASCSR